MNFSRCYFSILKPKICTTFPFLLYELWVFGIFHEFTKVRGFFSSHLFCRTRSTFPIRYFYIVWNVRRFFSPLNSLKFECKWWDKVVVCKSSSITCVSLFTEREREREIHTLCVDSNNGGKARIFNIYLNNFTHIFDFIEKKTLPSHQLSR